MSEHMKNAQQIAEALEYMRLLNLNESVISDFRKNQTVYMTNSDGTQTPLSPIAAKAVKEWEEQSKCVVYYVIHSFTDFGELLSLCTVSPYQEDWDTARKYIEYNSLCSYVVNLTDDLCSECGMIEVLKRKGNLYRIS